MLQWVVVIFLLVHFIRNQPNDFDSTLVVTVVVGEVYVVDEVVIDEEVWNHIKIYT